MTRIFLIIITLIVFTGCRKNNENKIGSEYFPNSVGNFWRYRVVDSILNTSVIVEVNIVGNKILSGGQNCKTWTYRFPDHMDTNYVYQAGDTVKFIDSKSLSPVNRYVIPLVINNKWSERFPFSYRDSVEVLEQRAFVLNNQTFNNSFLLKETASGPNFFLNKDEWFSPNIGMLTKVEKVFDVNPSENTYWELLNYQLH
jgi:hypothetical protein